MIHYCDISTEQFLCSWNDGKDYIEAHTSGSTGKPKTIKLSKRDMLASAESTCQFFDITNESTLYCPLSADYIAGKMMIVRSIVSGATLYMVKPSNKPLETCKVAHIDMLAIVPSQLPGLIEYTRQGLIDNVIIGGAPLSQEQERSLCTAPFNSYATYGMTETCSHVALRHINVSGSRIYKALPGYSFTVDHRSCLVIDTTIQSFHRLVTNDIVSLQDNRHFVWLGRHDNVIVTGGIKVHPEEIEQKLSQLIDRNFYITGTPDIKWGQHVVLCIEGDPIDTSPLINSMHDLINPYEIPREIRFINTFRRTNSGKIIRD